MLRFASLIALALLAACSPARQSQKQEAGQETATLPLLIRSGGGTHRFDVEVARTPAEQAQGLMFRRSLPEDGGMLFPMEPPRTASFWMKDTLIPLDLLFVHTDGSIAFLKAQAQPYDRTPVSAGVPVAAVLELRGGRAAELGISEGDRVSWGGCAVPEGRSAIDLNFCPAPPR
ncbi:DUF192 domain-containing protein [Sphingobium amiense]|uniref:DUF192 domain-containing protein n=1 Tax=Sphingobium amiense TaxID=135719 RepID=A0A494W049_9SPHN|nr:DUF192 domain-containing protein [Sphingobium amiense]BBD96518.1 DUF192 domain-containing protein [Sphingobium amiense]